MKKLKMFSSGIVMLVVFASFGVHKIAGPVQTAMTISGVVSDDSGPLPEATVRVKGTGRGTKTNVNGQYTIKASKGETLVFSFLGYKDKSVKISGNPVLNVKLTETVGTVNEVVVKDLHVKREQDALGYPAPKTTAQELSLPSRAPGVNVVAGASTKVMIRGYASMPNVKEVSRQNYQQNQRLDSNTEDYDSFIENPFEAPKNAPLSTFSIDVDNASYTNVRRFINNGQAVPKDAVRVEEMVNFFKYRYPQPKDAHPFSINTEYSASPWNNNHKLLRIGLQGKQLPTADLPASNLVFLIDVSGSMHAGNKLPLLVQSLKILVRELRAEDQVAIVVYAGAAGLVLPTTPGNEKQKIVDALQALTAGGSTAGGAGIQLAYQVAQEHFIKNGNNRVILATDGDFNVGANSNSDMEKLIEEKRKSGVFLTCLGYGMGNYKDSKMETLADKGNGNYAYIDNIQEANRFLGKEFKGSMYAIAKDVKIQIEFNPKQVAAYRLIGYENRKLRPEDFTNDKIDAGELGSGHTVTALYEIIPVGVKSEFLESTPALKYSKTEATGTVYNDELATVKFRYKKPDGDKSTEMVEVIGNKAESLSNASQDFKFCAAVAWFGLKLRESKLVANQSSEDIKKLAQSGLTNDADGYKAEFIRLVESDIKFSVR